MTSQHFFNETSPLLCNSASSVSGTRDAPHELQTPNVNEKRTSLAFRITATISSFIVLGLFTSSTGVMLQHISHYYALTDVHVSLIFLIGPIGYVLAAQSNDFIHLRFGQRGIALLGPICHIISAAVIAMCPPFPVVLVAFAIVATGTGLLDGSWCAWAASMSNANTISGLLHGSFSIGAAVGPFLTSEMLSAGHRQWYEWYFVLSGASVIELVILVSAFRYENASRHRSYNEHMERTQSNASLKTMVTHPAVWVSAAYFLAYVGTETATSGWLVSFMIRARHATPSLASLASSGFWAGMAVGRVALGAVTDKIGLSQATFLYFFCIISLEIVSAAVKNTAASLISMTMLGFFMGPLFPSGVVLLTQLLPGEYHVSAVSFVASVGQLGGALLPFGIGAVIQALGIEVFQYALVVLSFLTLMMWIAFARLQPSRMIASSEGVDEEE